MIAVSEIMPGVVQQNRLICKRCGTEVEFAPKQWRKTCTCGMVLALPKSVQVDKDKQPACFICKDKGLVFYQAQEGGQLYDYVARCICHAGQDRKEAYPAVDKVDNICDLQYLAQENCKAWEFLTGKKAEPVLLVDAVQAGTDELPF
jgi:hypothetical protein